MILKILEIIVLLFITYIIYGFCIYLISDTKHISIQESKAYIKNVLLELVTHSSVDIRLSQQDIVEILEVIAKFSSISPANTRRKVNYMSSIHTFKAEILDSSFLNNWEVIEANIGRVFDRIFAYNGIQGKVFVTYERTLKENIYIVVVRWATTRQAKKELQETYQRIADYNRKMDLEKSEPFIDRELEKEMDAMDSHEEA